MSKGNTTVSHAPEVDWFMIRGKKAMAARPTGGRVCVGVWKELPRKRGELIFWRDGQEMRLTPEEAMDLGTAIIAMARKIDPNVQKKYEAWVTRGRTRAPNLRLVKGGMREEERPR